MKYTSLKKILSLILVLVLALSLTACGTETPAEEVSDPETEVTAPEVSEESSEEAEESEEESKLVIEETGDISGFDAEELNSEASEEVSTDLTDEGYDLFLPAVTENEDFNAVFARNDIDMAYYDVATDSGSTTAIVRASNKAAAQWQTVIENAYDELKSTAEDTAATEKDQNDWNANVDAAVQAIKDKAGDDGLANITVSYEIMLLYREKAGQLLEQIYAITGELDLTAEVEPVG